MLNAKKNYFSILVFFLFMAMVILSASVKRFSVPCMRDFYLQTLLGDRSGTFKDSIGHISDVKRLLMLLILVEFAIDPALDMAGKREHG